MPAREFEQHHVSATALLQSRNEAVVWSTQKISFPVPWNSSVFDARGPLANGDSIFDLTTSVFAHFLMPGAPQLAFGSKVLNQLLLQGPTGLDIERFIDRLVRHVHALIASKLALQPAGNLLRRPVALQLENNSLPQSTVENQLACLWAQSSLPGTLIGLGGTIVSFAAIAETSRLIADDDRLNNSAMNRKE